MLTVSVMASLQMTQNEARGGVLRLVVAGGRAQEKPGASGAVAVGVRTLSEGGAVGGFSREQVEYLCRFVFNSKTCNWPMFYVHFFAESIIIVFLINCPLLNLCVIKKVEGST